MNQINLLEQDTIDKIAAGEVIERPASIVKELVENAIDAGSNAVTVEIKEGGISFIRITDNGEGISKDQVSVAFLRHATSKIRHVEDLLQIGSLGFRGEALSSIAAVCQVELITKTAGALTGIRYLIEGGKEKGMEEIGAPEGSTFLVRNIFFNTPARKKFLKSAMTEAGYISDLMERMALSRPDISFKFINNGQTKLHTSGNGKQMDIIYSIFGRDIASNLIRVDMERDGIKLSGYIGKPLVSRGNRNYENYFINGRYVRSNIIAKAIEEGYKTFLMQHRYPFTALCFEMDGELLDINVHPTKMELRFADNAGMYQLVYETVRDGLMHRDLILKTSFATEKEEKQQAREQMKQKEKTSAPEPFEKIRRDLLAESKSPYQPKYERPESKSPYQPKYERPESKSPYQPKYERPESKSLYQPKDERGQIEGTLPLTSDRSSSMEKPVASPAEQKASGGTVEEKSSSVMQSITRIPQQERRDVPQERTVSAAAQDGQQTGSGESVRERTIPDLRRNTAGDGSTAGNSSTAAARQLDLFEAKLLDEKSLPEHKMIGQIFDTYWIVQFRDSLYIIDQHAAHEKVMYERLTKSLKEMTFTTQMVSPPIILTLSLQEENLLQKYMDLFHKVGFEIEHFGGKEYSICGVPDNFYGFSDKTLFLDMLDSLSDTTGKPSADLLNEKLATMACKSAVKGNNRLSLSEADALIRELLQLENPYNCPHGRPTIISMSKYELEKKFKRIV